jgi:hypothetical protein
VNSISDESEQMATSNGAYFINQPMQISDPIKKLIFRTTANGAIDVYRAETNELLVTLIILKQGEWVITTPDGRFDTNKSLD